MDISLDGIISKIEINNHKDCTIVHFNIGQEDSILKQLPCYAVLKKQEDVAYFRSIDSSKHYCIEGAICSDEKNTDFQVHCIYQKPEKIYV